MKFSKKSSSSFSRWCGDQWPPTAPNGGPNGGPNGRPLSDVFVDAKNRLFVDFYRFRDKVSFDSQFFNSLNSFSNFFQTSQTVRNLLLSAIFSPLSNRLALSSLKHGHSLGILFGNSPFCTVRNSLCLLLCFLRLCERKKREEKRTID